MNQFKGSQGKRWIVGRNIDQNHIRVCAADSTQHRIGCCYRTSGARMHNFRHAGSVYQHLQDGSLFTILRNDYN